jgi:hypothetical protein
MSELKNKTLTKSLGPLFLRKWSKTTRKQVFHAFFGYFRGIWASLGGPKKSTLRPVNEGIYGPMSKLRD